ncbi:non-specific serine,threonine protein kinase [Sarracenia purpurea var. burkii]
MGTSKVHQTNQPSISVATYCAINLPRTFSVLAVDNGNILFEREGSGSIVCDLRDTDMGKGYVWPFPQSLSKIPKAFNNATVHAPASKSIKGQRLYLQKFHSSESSSN